jgi:hypothetical protein
MFSGGRRRCSEEEFRQENDQELRGGVARRSNAMLHGPYLVGAVFLLLLLGGALILRDAGSRGPPDQGFNAQK